MTVAISFDRKAVEITWDTDKVQGRTVVIEAVNPDNQDVSQRETDNDGRATITFPYDYHGSAHVTVSGSEGGSDDGTISV